MSDVHESVESLDPDLCDRLRLSLVSGIGPRLQRALLDRFETAARVLSAPRSELSGVKGVGPKLVQAIEAGRHIDLDDYLDRCRRLGVRLLTRASSEYPAALQEISDPPEILYVRGGLTSVDALAVAIVGSRHATRYGVTQAERLAGSLARAGVTIVSGLARGVDAAAHRAALSAGGRTLAVLASGVARIYPPEHEELARDVAAGGALVSEASIDAKPLAGAFPQRNRIISGLSLGVVVVEASERSGALITARHAGEQNREVFAVPGSVDSRLSRGCHRLLRDGAKLVESADDVLEELGPLATPAVGPQGQVVRHPGELRLNELEQRILAAVPTEPVTVDQVIVESGAPAPQVLSTLSVLEMRRLVRRLGGSRIVRC